MATEAGPRHRPIRPRQSSTSPSPSDGASLLLGKYRLGCFLGRGNFAKVYQAHSLADNTAVAIKIIDKTTVEATLERCIVREIAAMRRLDQHPNILRIHEVMATKSKIYLVVELAAGGELFSKICRRRRLTEAVSRRYFQQLLTALSFCHENGIAHRDLKPQNLLLDEYGNLKISDFGLSALPEQLKDGLLNTACGTPAYSAPEVMVHRRSGYNGPKADAWSCGIILFMLLSGFLPFDDSNLATMYKKIYRRDYQFPEWISKPVRHIIYHLLDPNPNTRMSIESVMQNPWFKKSLRRNQANDYKLETGDAPLLMNAFDIISMSSGLNLSGLFEATEKMEDRKFTASITRGELEEKMKMIGDELGYEMETAEKGVAMGIKIGKGRVTVIMEVLEVAPTFLMVEVKVVRGRVEFEELHWGSLETKLEGIIVPWLNNCKV